MIGGTLAGAVAIVAVLIAVSVGGSHSKPAPKLGSAGANKVAATVDGLLSGIPQSGNRLGSPTAPVTVTEFGDLECPICQAFTLGAQNTLIANEVRTGKVKLIYRSLCTATCNGPGQSVFISQQAAAIAAGKQDREWNYVELFYHLQGPEDTDYATPTYLTGLAKLVPGLNLTSWQSERTSSSSTSQVESDESFVAAQGWQSETPTIVFSGVKGQTQPVQGDLSYSDLQEGIKAVS